MKPAAFRNAPSPSRTKPKPAAAKQLNSTPKKAALPKHRKPGLVKPA